MLVQRVESVFPESPIGLQVIAGRGQLASLDGDNTFFALSLFVNDVRSFQHVQVFGDAGALMYLMLCFSTLFCSYT
jgi:hypothetical protein